MIIENKRALFYSDKTETYFELNSIDEFNKHEKGTLIDVTGQKEHEKQFQNQKKNNDEQRFLKFMLWALSKKIEILLSFDDEDNEFNAVLDHVRFGMYIVRFKGKTLGELLDNIKAYVGKFNL